MAIVAGSLFGASAFAADRYPLGGTVESLSPDSFSMTISHEGIEGLLEAGKTSFSAMAGDLAFLQPGQVIRGEVFRYGAGFRIEQVYLADPVAQQTAEAMNKRLRVDTVTRGRRVLREVGEPIPNFGLFNQQGELVTSNDIKGSRAVVNFIFTRCGMPTMCPAATQRMIHLQERAAEAEVENFRLITITFDPEYDSPGVLYTYATERGADLTNFDFLTGDPTAINDLMVQFGILRRGEGPMMQHTMSTVLIDEAGRIAWRRDGSNWSAEEFIARLKNESEKS